MTTLHSLKHLFSIATLVGGAALLAAPAAQAITFGQGGEFPWTTPLLDLNGSAHVQSTATGNVLRLTNDAPGQAGSGFFVNPYVLGNNTDFVSNFTFQITSSPGNPPSNRSDGLAFVIAANPSLVGGGGGGMGYGSTNPLVPSVAVEFDTYWNGFDPSDSHIGVMTNGNETIHLAQANVPALMDTGDVWQVMIHYFGQGNLLVVNLTDLTHPAYTAFLSYNIDIPAIMGCGSAGCNNSYLGLTAGTGGGYANHDILAWSAQVPEPGSLTLATLGLSTLVGLRRRRA